LSAIIPFLERSRTEDKTADDYGLGFRGEGVNGRSKSINFSRKRKPLAETAGRPALRIP